MTERRYAEDTRVPVANTQAEIKKWLRRAGADEFAVYDRAVASAVAFRLAGRFYRLDVPVAGPAQAERAAWRLLLLVVRAKLEAAAAGLTTIEREFMADTVMPDGSTLGAWVEPQISEAYRVGRMPQTLLLEGPK